MEENLEDAHFVHSSEVPVEEKSIDKECVSDNLCIVCNQAIKSDESVSTNTSVGSLCITCRDKVTESDKLDSLKCACGCNQIVHSSSKHKCVGCGNIMFIECVLKSNPVVEETSTSSGYCFRCAETLDKKPENWNNQIKDLANEVNGKDIASASSQIYHERKEENPKLSKPITYVDTTLNEEKTLCGR